MALRAIKTDVPMQRIYLMPTPTTPSCSTSDGRSHHFAANGGVAVYATVPIGGLTEEEARRMHATEAWVPTASPAPPGSPRAHRHTHSHSHSHVRSHSHPHSHRHHASSGRTNSRCGSGDEKTSFAV